MLERWHQFRALAALMEDLASVSTTTQQLTIGPNSRARDQVPLTDFFRYQANTKCSYILSGQTLTHIK